MANSVFFIQIMNAKDEYIENGNKSLYIDRLKDVLSHMEKYSSDEDISHLISSVRYLLDE